VVKPFVAHISDTMRLHLIRYSIVGIALVALYIAIQEGSIYEIVGASYSITLVSAFIPMVFGLYTKRANTLGALLAIIFGALSWQYIEHFGGEDPLVPSIIVGLSASFIGMLLGIVLEKVLKNSRTVAS
jgi:Na+/proline symporter